MKIYIAVLCVLFTTSLQKIHAQHTSIHAEQLQYFNHLESAGNLPVVVPASMNAKNSNTRSCTLTRKVFGYHPYWSNGLENNYDWNLITDFCYAFWEFSPTTGAVTNSHSWASVASVTTAHNNGARVHLCANLFSNHATFLNNLSARSNMITNLIAALKLRNAIGVNIDFESVPLAQKDSLTSFMIELCNRVHDSIPGSIVSVAMPAVDWSVVWDIPVLKNYVDWFVIMGYDYYYSGSTTAGPTAPLYTFLTAYDRNLSRSITYYLNAGVHQDSLILAVPYYGREWSTTSSAVPSSTIANIGSVFYNVMRGDTLTYANRMWEPNSFSPYFVYYTGTEWRQCFIDDEQSLGSKYDLVNIRDIGGIGIWALGYDDGYSELWDIIEEKLTDCAVIPCSDTIWDLGGPTRNYYNYETFTYTIAPTNATSLSLHFSSFALENGWDTLFIYDGSSTASTLIGFYTGSNSPGLVNASGNALTLRYKSDISTVAAGWEAIWQCGTDNIPPTTQITSPQAWQTGTGNAVFTDYDNLMLQEEFFNVSYWDSDQSIWLANSNLGFLNHSFEGSLVSDWTSQTGTWSIQGEALFQSANTNANTNIYIPLNTNDADVYLYHWKMKIGTGDVTNNRRAGLHYFCDNPALANRGNSYFVYFRVENAKVQLYECINDTFYLRTNDSYPFLANSWYDLKILYNKGTGKHTAFINNEVVSSLTDDTPLQNGSWVSLRTGNCEAWYDDIRVYQNRSDNETLISGAGTNAHLRFQNSSPSIQAGCIRSIVIDAVNLWSDIDSLLVHVDWTAPIGPAMVFDGIASDQDTIFSLNTVPANWTTATDSNSGVSGYYIALGSAPGLSDVATWTNIGDVSNWVLNALSMIHEQNYFISIYALNNAGIANSAVSSDGFVAYDPLTAIENIKKNDFSVYPNPVSSVVYITSPSFCKGLWVLSDSKGQIIESGTLNDYSTEIPMEQYASGEYTLTIIADSCIQTYRLLKD